MDGPEWGEQFLDLWLRASGGDVFGQRAEASGLLRVDSPDPEGGLSRPPPLWSVLGGQAGCEEELKTEHLPCLGPTGGPGQPPKGRVQAMPGKRGALQGSP